MVVANKLSNYFKHIPSKSDKSANIFPFDLTKTDSFAKALEATKIKKNVSDSTHQNDNQIPISGIV